MRFDVLEVILPPGKTHLNAEVTHIKAAFDGEDTPFSILSNGGIFMNYKSTRNSALSAKSAEAIARGISEDGGLFCAGKHTRSFG